MKLSTILAGLNNFLSSLSTRLSMFYLGMVILFASNFNIVGTLSCSGQLLSISTNTALFSLIGTFYGGNGTTDFGVPDLRGRVPIGQGQGPGLAYYPVGQAGGAENTPLTVANLPAHTHSVSISVTVSASNTAGTTNVPSAGTSTLAVPVDPYSGDTINLYNGGAPTVALNTMATATGNTGSTGSSIAVSVLQPYLTMTYLIVTSGVYPSRN